MKNVTIKTLISLLLTLAVALGLFGSARAASVGDLNGDGKITAADARLALRAAVGLDQLSGEKKTLADVNQDGKVTAADARKILRITVGLEKTDSGIPVSEDESLSFADLSATYVFSSGAGAWGTVLYLQENGTFYGDYHDSNLDTVYYCTFKGIFAKPIKIDQYSYSMHIDRFEITDDYEKYEGLKYIKSDPYGLEGASELIVYIPGTPLSAIPKAYQSWIHLSGSATKLPDNKYVLCNETGHYAFVGTVE